MSFSGVGTWFMKLHTKYLNDISIAYHKAIKRMCNKGPNNNNHKCLERVYLPIFKHLFAKKLINFAFSVFQSKSPSLSSHKYYFVPSQALVKKKNMKNIKTLTYYITPNVL